jgi:hypothetical protein
MLDIKVTLSEDEGNAPFVMEAVDLNDSVTIPVFSVASRRLGFFSQGPNKTIFLSLSSSNGYLILVGIK